MKKILFSVFALVLTAAVVVSLPVFASAESMYIRKVVSLVYDDSTSMNGGDRWAYANYATQAFAGLLNSDDQLFITYMSECDNGRRGDPKELDLSSGGIQGSVDSIRDHDDAASTPYDSVETAFKKLTDVKDTNPNTQYWLVVITDGSFNEMYGMTVPRAEKFINEKFEEYVSAKMPNGSNAQITFLGIGDVVSPKEDAAKGIYTYSASNASGIIGAMSEMADKISGRTRLGTGDVKQIDGKTVQVSSTIPLLNIAVLSQKSEAKISKAVYSSEIGIPVSRSVSLQYPGHRDLVGGAFLLGDSKNIIGAGTYKITFDRDVDLKDLVILFEPALETRMVIAVNGVEISDPAQLDDVAEGDKVTVSCKIYEMGTEVEVDPSLLPPGTRFEVSVAEDGKVVRTEDGKEMELKDYELKNIETKITAAVIIDGFHPIEYYEKFTPTERKVVYTLVPSFGGAVKSVSMSDLPSNKDLSIRFTVFADGVEMTDPEAVKALNPQVNVSLNGNSGVTSVDTDGRIVYLPNAGVAPAGTVDSYNVDVTCTVNGNVSATETYTVLLADFDVIPVDHNESIKKTELHGNTKGVSFYVTKDGKQMLKADVEQGISVLFNESHEDLKYDVSVANDGVITVIPYSEKDYGLKGINWLWHWFQYFFLLEGDDVTVTLQHPYGTAENVLDVRQESLPYLLLNVVLPLLLEVLILAYAVAQVYTTVNKPRFLKNATLYLGDLTHSGTRGNRYHEIGTFKPVALDQYNKFKYRFRLIPTMKTKIIPLQNGVSISAGDGGSILCHGQVWYRGEITPVQFNLRNRFDHPAKVAEYVQDNSLKIQVLSPYDEDAVEPIATIDRPSDEMYYVFTDMTKDTLVDGIAVIANGMIVAYALPANQ